MKHLYLRITLVIAALLGVQTSTLAADNPFVGSWQLVSGKYLDGKGKWIHYGDLKLSAIKVISASHFSFTTMKNVGTLDKPKQEFWAAGTGSYTYSETDYIEYPQLNSFGVAPDKPFAFTYEIKGDKWQTQRVENGELKEQELWKKLD
ncbi:hypothetical protein [Shewanella kaireitica]|uniref:hypothetical protein n=1 Tax=Shewanella kaireitica TaxID=212021 RepID=UPI002010273F|nr:hypothetical protein [Shewanella kaireitica]MCL1093267.1 hypothetical protein [Shewanella kaireitica]